MRKNVSFSRLLHLNWELQILAIWTGNFPLVINVLTNTPKTSPNNSGDIFQMNFRGNDGKTWKKRSHGDFTSISDAFTYWLPKPVLKRFSLESVLTKFFTVCNFGNTLGMTMTFSFKMFKIRRRFQKWNKKSRKCF